MAPKKEKKVKEKSEKEKEQNEPKPKKEKEPQSKKEKSPQPKKEKEPRKKEKEPKHEYSPTNTLDEEEGALSPRCIYIEMRLDCPEPNPIPESAVSCPEINEFLLMNFVVIFQGQIYIDSVIQNGDVHTVRLSQDLRQPRPRAELADSPLVFLLKDRMQPHKHSEHSTSHSRSHSAAHSTVQSIGPLLDFSAGATVDLFPLAIGEPDVFVHVPLVRVPNGEPTGIAVNVFAKVPPPKEKSKSEKREERTLMTITMLEAYYLPHFKEHKEGTMAYISALGFDKLLDPPAIHFGPANSHKEAKRSVWANVSALGSAGSTLMNLPDEDIFLPEDMADPGIKKEDSRITYWHARKRILINRADLTKRLKVPLFFELALVPKMGKYEAKARYMAFIDASILLEPGVYGATVCAKLKFFNEFELSETFTPVLDFPPPSARSMRESKSKSARENKSARFVREPGIIQVTDEQERHSIIKIRFDLTEPLVPHVKTAVLFDIMGYPGAGTDKSVPFDELYLEPPPEDPTIDVHKIRKECGALAVHKELGTLACRGSVPMNQSIKRTAANRLLMRVRTMVKQFAPAPSPQLQWMDTVSSQHAASRRAVNASFMPPPAPLRLPPRYAACRSLVGGQETIARDIIETNLKVLPDHPRSLLLQALSLLEEGEDTQALSFLVKALDSQPRNRFLLWAYGAQEFFKDSYANDKALAAFRISVRGDPSDGVGNSIGWAVLHAVYHFNREYGAAFIAAKRMRKYFKLPMMWEGFLKRWADTSGREEIYWNPNYVLPSNPFLLSAAFFLCLRGFMMSNILLRCFENGCYSRGSCRGLKTDTSVPDLAYLRSASLLLRRQFYRALKLTDDAILARGPEAVLSQMRNTCLTCERGWDEDCQRALEESERFGIMNSPAVLYQSALHGYKTDPNMALQRAGRAHMTFPGPCSALLIGRIYLELGREDLAERWAAMSVKMEPKLTDGWAFLGMMALQARDIDKAHVLLHTARETGTACADIADEIHRLVIMLHANRLPDSLMKKLCVCETCCSCSEDNMIA